MAVRFLAGCVVVASLMLAFGTMPVAQTPTPSVVPALPTSLVGRDSFALYCASCHGSGGRGDGPVAGALKTRPADLTGIALRNNGSYPRDRIRDFIVGIGRTPAAHGTTDMPIWGPLFRFFESDERARVRVENLVAYLETLQAPTTGADSLGSQLFRTYCASCHGSDARGTGPLAQQLRHMPPNLTQFTQRNGGMFPSERVRRIIDGRDIPSHGDREMPIWGDAFRALPGGSSEAAVKARIDAVVRYLEGIQERGA